MANVQVYALTTPAKRGANKMFYALNNENQVVEVTIYAAKDGNTTLAHKVVLEKHFLLRNANVAKRESAVYVTLRADTGKIFQAGTLFPVDQDVVDKFNNPDTVTVAEAKASPKKRKITIQGEVVQVKALKTGPTWTRRDMIIKDQNAEIPIKMWNQQANLVTEAEQGSIVRFQNLEVDIFNNQHQLKSLEMSSITIAQAPPAAAAAAANHHTVVAIDEDENTGLVTLLTDSNQELEVPKDVLTASRDIEEILEATPVDVEIESVGGNITTVTFI